MAVLGRNQPLPDFDLRPEGDSNPCYRRERAVASSDYRNAAFIFSSIPAPGHSSFSESLLNGVSTVLRWAWRSSELVSRYRRPVTTSPFAAWWATYSSAWTRSVGS